MVLCSAVPVAAPTPAAAATRLKDLVSVRGVRANQVIGYGLVVGLNGSGDKDQTEFTVQSLASLLARIGIGVDAEEIRVKNVAAVMVTGMLPPFARVGGRIDAVVSSIGDATSLEGGTLLVTPLFGTDGQVYALAQGPISVGGFSAGGGGGSSSVQKNHPTVGRIASGATVEREVPHGLEDQTQFDLTLARADFTTALRAARTINRNFDAEIARPLDSGTVRLELPDPFRGRPVEFLARVESLEVEPDRPARVVLNERTGTVVMGSEVRVGKVAVAHGNLAVSIAVTNEVSQPEAFARRGRTQEVQNSDVEAVEEESSLAVIEGPVTIEELVRGLNAIGVSSRDLIVILQAIQAAGALSAELELM
ncbi:MAG: flagellar basal body P-ring protein FlgI [Myxococcota bacterium]